MKEKGDGRDDPMNNPADTNLAQRSGIDLFAGDRNAIVERAYGTPDVARSRQAMVAALAIRPGEAIIEIGSGPGYMTVDMAAATGPAGRLHALDISADMVARTRARCGGAGLANVTFGVGDMAALPTESDAYDVAAVGQVLEYMIEPAAGMAEIFRVLKPGGRAAILDIDWGTLIWHAEDAGRLARVVEAAQGFRPDPYVARRIPALAAAVGLRLLAADALVTVNTTFGEDTLSRWMFELMRLSGPETGAISDADADAAYLEFQRLSDTGAYYFSINRCLFMVEKPA